jgi:hypothetical protein
MIEYDWRVSNRQSSGNKNISRVAEFYADEWIMAYIYELCDIGAKIGWKLF